MTTLPSNLKRLTLDLSLIFTNGVFKFYGKVRLKIKFELINICWLRSLELTWVMSSWWLSVYDPMTSAFLLSLFNAKRINIDIESSLIDMKETNMVYYEIPDTVHLIGTTKFIKFYIWHFLKPKLTKLICSYFITYKVCQRFKLINY